MKRIRTKVTALTLLVVFAGIFGTIAVTTDTLVRDERSDVVEFNSIAAPNVAAAIGKPLDHLEQQFTVFDHVLRGMRTLPESGDLLKAAFRSLEGVERLQIYDSKGIV